MREESTRRRLDDLWGRLIDGKQGLVTDVDNVNITLKTMRGRGRGKQIISCGGRVNTAGMDKKDAYA